MKREKERIFEEDETNELFSVVLIHPRSFVEVAFGIKG